MIGNALRNLQTDNTTYDYSIYRTTTRIPFCSIYYTTTNRLYKNLLIHPFRDSRHRRRRRCHCHRRRQQEHTGGNTQTHC